MNKNLYRLVFSKKSGFLIAVAETTASQSKSTGETSLGGAQKLAHGIGGAKLAAMSLATALVFLGLGSHSTNSHAQNVLPTGGTINTGMGSINTNANGNVMTITQGSNVLSTNWSSFSIGASNSVIFNQPSASAIAINRVMGNSQSQIFGNLQANGQVFLINPNGVMFGRGAQVQVGALVATTKNITDAQIAAGNYTFSGTSSAGIINQGNIQATGANGTGGYIVLHADSISNDGTLTANGGTITLAAGQTLGLSLDNGQLLGAQITGVIASALVQNKGLIVADGGAVYLTARGKDMLLNTVVNNEGIVQAKSLNLKNGVIILDGGSLGGDVLNSGTLDTSGSGSNKGGTIIMAGDRVGVLAGATINASGDAGGGKVIIGGDNLHKVTNIMSVGMSAQTVVQAGSNINISSKNGDGGFVETSGQVVSIASNINGAAPNGKAGQWLIDPADIVITNPTETAVNTSAGNNQTFSATTLLPLATVLNTSIVNSLNNGTNVIVTTANGSLGIPVLGALGLGAPGNITVLADIIKTGTNAATLTLLANGSITVSSNITATGGTLGVNLTADSGNIGGGGVLVSALGSINTGGGILSISGNTSGLTSGDAVKIMGNINAANASSTITGYANTSAGVSIVGASVTAGTITGTSNSGTGVWVQNNATNLLSIVGSNNQTIHASLVGSSNTGTGVWIQNDASIASLAGLNVTGGGNTQIFNGNISGSSATGTGVLIQNDASVINTTTSICGTGAIAVSIGNNTQIFNGNINGVSNAGTGVLIQNDASVINTTLSTGTITVSNGNNTQIFNGNVSGFSTAGTGVALVGALDFINTNISGSSSSGIGVNSTASLNITNTGYNNVSLIGQSQTGNGLQVAGNFSAANSGNGSLSVSGSSASGVSDIVLNGTSNIIRSVVVGNISGTGSLNISTDRDYVLSGVNLTSNTSSLNVNVSSGNLTLTGALATGGNLTLAAGTQDAAGTTTSGDVIVAGGSMAANTSGGGGTISIYSGTPHTANANTSAFQAVTIGATNTTTSKAYNSSASALANTSQVLNVFYRIAPTVTISVSNSSKVYDTTTNGPAATNTTVNVTGLIDGDTVNTSNTLLAYNTASAGTNLTIGITNLSGITYSGNGLISGYGMTVNNATGATISKATVTLNQSASVNSKVYDTTNVSSLNTGAPASFNVALGSSSANGSTVSSSFASSNVTVTASAFNQSAAGAANATLSYVVNSDTANYTFASGANTSTAFATISKATVTLNQSASVNSKVYDTTNGSSLNTSAPASFNVQLGDSNRSGNVANNSTLTSNAANATPGVFNQSAVGTGLNATINYNIVDTANYTFAGSVNRLTESVTGLTISPNLTANTSSAMSGLAGAIFRALMPLNASVSMDQVVGISHIVMQSHTPIAITHRLDVPVNQSISSNLSVVQNRDVKENPARAKLMRDVYAPRTE